jgi:hypothetical protein
VKIKRRPSFLVVVVSVVVAGSMMFCAPSAYAQTIKLAWDPSSDSATVGYNVYRSQQSGTYPSTPLNGSNVVTSAAFTDSSVQTGSTYYYVVTTVNANGLQSGYSNQVQATVPVLTTNNPPVVGSGVQLAASPTSVSPGSTLNATWAQIASPTALDWIGVYQPGSSNTAYLDWFYVSCSKTSGSPPASRSCPFVVPSSLAPGTYQLRLFANDGFTLLATSNNFTITNAPSVPTPASTGRD